MEGSVDFRILGDKWTAVSADNKRWALNNRYIQFIYAVTCLQFTVGCFNGFGLQNETMSMLCFHAGQPSLSTQLSSHLTE